MLFMLPEDNIFLLLQFYGWSVTCFWVTQQITYLTNHLEMFQCVNIRTWREEQSCQNCYLLHLLWYLPVVCASLLYHQWQHCLLVGWSRMNSMGSKFRMNWNLSTDYNGQHTRWMICKLDFRSLVCEICVSAWEVMNLN